jgi:hypothetical protein
MERIRNTFLFPEKTYKNLTGKMATLIPGIVFVGLADVAIPYLTENCKALYNGADTINLVYNICVSVLAVFIIGTLDITLFSIPLLDIFNLSKKEGKGPYSGEYGIKLMKIYVLAHLPVIPLQWLIYFITLKAGTETASIQGIGFLFIISLLLTLWFNAIISRGVNILYNFQPIYKRLVFPLALIWGYILGTGMNYVLGKWLLKLFRL